MRLVPKCLGQEIPATLPEPPPACTIAGPTTASRSQWKPMHATTVEGTSRRAHCGYVAGGGGVKAGWIISASDPIRIRVTRIWIKVLDIHEDMDNPHPIVADMEEDMVAVSDIYLHLRSPTAATLVRATVFFDTTIDMTSLVKVDICFREWYSWETENNEVKTFNDVFNPSNRKRGKCNLIKFFNRLRQIRCLKISSCEYLKVIDRVVGSIGKFNNLTKLELQVGVEWHLLVKFLEVADNLEVLIADVEIHNSCMEPKQVPKCLQSSLKTITIKQQGFEEHELDLVRYLLRNSQVLQRMEILPRKDRSTSTSENGFEAAFKALQRISLFERGSKACQLAFFSDC
ncbi:F-box/FBD/LRR-repeat protein [Striga hermonthica]|uniref:F-box/FBD/LRR-repeat protein n=1 Tax=Striga hermonthica TaxID=68872 RepID=A0A9N7MW85_STRHE|nr:F-box/FBD/LRR-repeat protein [Striga hermonthica]